MRGSLAFNRGDTNNIRASADERDSTTKVFSSPPPDTSTVWMCPVAICSPKVDSASAGVTSRSFRRVLPELEDVVTEPVGPFRQCLQVFDQSVPVLKALAQQQNELIGR
jgi:hypothetical protein